MGFCSIGDVNYKSAAYVARYIMKKITGPPAEEHYSRSNPITGEIWQVMPEYTTMSRRPGIGAGWLDKYTTDVYPDDFIIMNNKKVRPPRFYDRIYEADNPKGFQKVRIERKLNTGKHADNNTKDRLKVREAVQQSRLDKLERTVE